MLEMQLNLEKLYAKNNLIRRINTYWFDEGLIDSIEAEVKGLIRPLTAKVITQVFLHRRVPIGVLVGMLIKQYKLQDILCHVYALLELKVIKWDGERLVTVLLLPPDIQKEIDQYQFPLPMVCEPEKITNNQESGYLSIKKNVVLQQRNSIGDYCLELLNKINSIPLVLDWDTAAQTERVWKNVYKRKDDEPLHKYQKKLKAFDKYCSSSDAVFEAVKFVDKFYLTHSYDKRGRIYCNGYHISYQGIDYNKAVINFANKELICNS